MLNKQTLNVRLLTFNSFDCETKNDEEDSEEFSCKKKEYIVQMFGITDENKRISIRATNFNPYFYIRISDNWEKKHIRGFILKLKKLVKDTLKYKPENGMGYYEGALKEYSVVNRKKLYGFNGGKLCRFIKLVFINEQVMIIS